MTHHWDISGGIGQPGNDDLTFRQFLDDVSALTVTDPTPVPRTARNASGGTAADTTAQQANGGAPDPFDVIIALVS